MKHAFRYWHAAWRALSPMDRIQLVQKMPMNFGSFFAAGIAGAEYLRRRKERSEEAARVSEQAHPSKETGPPARWSDLNQRKK